MDKQNLYVADGGNNCIRKISASGTVTTLAGTGVAGYLDGSPTSAKFNNPTGVCVDDSFNVYVADFQNHRIRKIQYNGVVITISGSGTAGYVDGPPASAQFDYPRGICRNKNGIIYVGDSWNHRIRKILPNGTTSTYAGGGSAMGVSSVGSLKDAKDTAARFYTPAGLAIDKVGNVYVADAYNHRIRKIDTTKQVTTIAGSGATGIGNGGYSNGAVASASLNTPTELNCDSTGTKIYIGDTFNNRVRMVSSGSLTLVAGKGIAGYLDGQDTVARFNYSRGVVANPSGTKIFVVDFNNHAVRKISIGSTTAINENSSEKEYLIVYPNPNNGTFFVTTTKVFSGSLTVKLLDMLGKEIYSGNSNEDQIIELKNIRSGIYSLLVSDKTKTVVKKLVIQE